MDLRATRAQAIAEYNEAVTDLEAGIYADFMLADALHEMIADYSETVKDLAPALRYGAIAAYIRATKQNIINQFEADAEAETNKRR